MKGLTVASELRGLKSNSARFPRIGTDEKEAPASRLLPVIVGVKSMLGSTKSRRKRGVPNAKLEWSSLVHRLSAVWKG